MSDSRSHEAQIELNATPSQVFKALITPSAICEWWQASSAIVIPRIGGIWIATWGNIDDPDYISSFKMIEFERPRAIVFDEGVYIAKLDPPPFELDTTTKFEIEPRGETSCILRVLQTGFPVDPIADDFYAACEVGWRNTFAGIETYFST